MRVKIPGVVVVTIGQFDSSLESGQSSFPSQYLSFGIQVLLFWHSNSLSVHPKNYEKVIGQKLRKPKHD